MTEYQWGEAQAAEPAMIAYGSAPGQIVSAELASAILITMHSANPAAFGRALAKAIVAQAAQQNPA